MVLIAIGLPSLGCAQAAPVEAWQRQIEHYVQHHGQGNPAVLANLAREPAQRRFDHIGDRVGLIAPQRTDTHGILVGHRRVDGALWFVYLVGVVQDQGGIIDVNFDRPVVRAIHPVAFALDPDSGRLRWVIGEADGDALERYLAQQRERWARSHPARTADDVPHTRFPRPYDRFELIDKDRALTVRHPATGASWPLRLP